MVSVQATVLVETQMAQTPVNVAVLKLMHTEVNLAVVQLAVAQLAVETPVKLAVVKLVDFSISRAVLLVWLSLQFEMLPDNPTIQTVVDVVAFFARQILHVVYYRNLHHIFLLCIFLSTTQSNLNLHIPHIHH
jgi:hypothetical protein